MPSLESPEYLAFSIAQDKNNEANVGTFHYNKKQILEWMKKFQKIVRDGRGFARSENAIPLSMFGVVYHTFIMEICHSPIMNVADGYGNFSFLRRGADGSGLNDLIRRLEMNNSPKLIFLFKSEKNRDETLNYIMRHPQAVEDMMGPNGRHISAQRILAHADESRKYTYCDGLEVFNTQKSTGKKVSDIDANWIYHNAASVTTCTRSGAKSVWRTLFFDDVKERINLARKRAERMWKTQRHYYEDWDGELVRRMQAMNLKWPRPVEIPYNAPYLETVLLMDLPLYIQNAGVS